MVKAERTPCREMVSFGRASAREAVTYGHFLPICFFFVVSLVVAFCRWVALGRPGPKYFAGFSSVFRLRGRKFKSEMGPVTLKRRSLKRDAHCALVGGQFAGCFLA